MRVIATSDTHGNHPDPKSVPDGDVFVHCGDFTNYGRPGEIARFAAWLRELPHEHNGPVSVYAALVSPTEGCVTENT